MATLVSHEALATDARVAADRRGVLPHVHAARPPGRDGDRRGPHQAPSRRRDLVLRPGKPAIAVQALPQFDQAGARAKSHARNAPERQAGEPAPLVESTRHTPMNAALEDAKQ